MKTHIKYVFLKINIYISKNRHEALENALFPM